MPQPHLLNGIILQVAHDRIKLHHTVRNRRSCGKSHTTPTGNFIQIPAFRKHIGTFLSVCLRNSRNISHLCVQEKIFVKMTFIHKQPIHTKLLKRHHIIFPALVIKPLQFCLQVLPCLLHLFYGIVHSILLSSFLNSHRNLINLLFDRQCLPFP